MDRRKIHASIKISFKDEFGKHFLRSKQGMITERLPGAILASVLAKVPQGETLVQITLTK